MLLIVKMIKYIGFDVYHRGPINYGPPKYYTESKLIGFGTSTSF